jgi:hypothetical protein
MVLLLSLMLLVGGGLFQQVFGVVAGIIGTCIKPNSKTKKQGDLGT